MKAPPPGWPRMSASAFYEDPHAAITWLCRAFGFEVRMMVEEEDGTILHSEIRLEEALIMVYGTRGHEAWQKIQTSPAQLGGRVTQALAFYIDDVDAHHERAAAAGATIVRAPATNDYGPEYWIDRSYGALDPEGHLWWFMQRLSTGHS